MGFQEEFEGAAVYTIATRTIRAAFKPGLSLILKILMFPFAGLVVMARRDAERTGSSVAPEFKPQYEMFKKRLEYQRIDPMAGAHGWNETDWPGSTLDAKPVAVKSPEVAQMGRPVFTVDDEELWKE
jgi:hypothetical protein